MLPVDAVDTAGLDSFLHISFFCQIRTRERYRCTFEARCEYRSDRHEVQMDSSYACINGNDEAVEALIEGGAAIAKSDGNSAKDYAIQRGFGPMGM